MKKILFVSVLFVALISCYSAATELSNETREGDDSKVDCVRFDFRWLELENVLYSEKIRHIEVFMDERAFSEENLRSLFDYISKKNPNPTGLTVQVHTNWAQ